MRKKAYILLASVSVIFFILWVMSKRRQSYSIESMRSIAVLKGFLPVASTQNVKSEERPTVTLTIKTATTPKPNPNDAFEKCKFYKQLTDVDFSQPEIKKNLCKNAVLYEKPSSGNYPVCEIPDSVPDVLNSSTKKGSVKTFIYGYSREQVTIYTLPKPDLVSSVIIDRHDWEGGDINRMIKYALSLQDVTFLDIGCNVGVFTLSAAKAGLRTVSLDANIRNVIRVRMSLQDNGINSSNSKILWGFVTTDGGKLQQLIFPSDCNSGGADKQLGQNFKPQPDPIKVLPFAAESLKSFIKTKRVVMKMDVQAGEAEFLKTVGSLFDDFDIAVFMMEWWSNMNWTSFLGPRSYKPFYISSSGLAAISDMKKAKYWSNVVWVKNEYIPKFIKVV